MAKRRAAVEKVGFGLPNHHMVSANLAEHTLGEVLRSLPVWTTDARTVVVAEGVAMYLSEEEVLTLLNAIRDNTGSGSRFVFSYLMADDKGGRLSAE